MTVPEQTQPRSPIETQPVPHVENDENNNGGPGCMVWGCFGTITIGLALLIVVLAAMAGIGSGLNTARAEATQTQAADIAAQCNWIMEDIRSGAIGLVEVRMEYLAGLTPVPDCLPALIPSATALFVQMQPTATPTSEPATPTPEPVVMDTPAPDTTPEATTSTNTEYDLQGLLRDARTAVSVSQWTDAIDLLEAIAAIDPNFQKTEVESLLFKALTSEANRLFQTGNLAEGIFLADKAEEFGDIDSLNYERYIASLYLDAQRYAGVNYNEAIRLLRLIVYTQGLVYYQGGDAAQLLYDQFMAYAKALETGGEPCPAVQQYANALQLGIDVPNLSTQAGVVTMRDAAQAACIQLTQQAPITTVPGDGEPTPTLIPVGSTG